jgi:hypothetical protein
MAGPTKPQLPNMRSIVATIRHSVTDTLLEEIGTWAEAQKDGFVGKIESQDFPDFRAILYPDSGTNLSPQYLQRKKGAKVDMRTMIATGNYKNSIRVWRKLGRSRQGATWRIGFHPRKLAVDFKNNRTNMLLSQIAMIQEFGSVGRNIPARKHWRPHLTAMHKNALAVRPQMRRIVVRNLRKSLLGKAQVT